MYFYLYLQIVVCIPYYVVLNSTGSIIREFCVNHIISEDLIVIVQDYDISNINIKWQLVSIVIDNSMTVNGCLTQQFQKRVYADWNYRIGSQIMNSNRSEFNFNLNDPADFYYLIEPPYASLTNVSVTYGPVFKINKTSLVNNADYYLQMTGLIGNSSIQFQQTIQIRVMLRKGELIPTKNISISKLIQPDQETIEFITTLTYDWQIFIREPTRFGSRLSTLTQTSSNAIYISLAPTWTDKLYVVTFILTDSYGIQYYQADWFHQIGQQWANQSLIDCNISLLMQNQWTDMYSCLEWSSGEFPVLLPQYDFIGIDQNRNCSSNSVLQQSYQPIPYCICMDNFTGINCDVLIDVSNYTIMQEYNTFLIDSLANQTLDNTTYQRVIYLLVKEIQGFDKELFDLINNHTYQFTYQLLLTYDTLALKTILNNNTNVTKDVFQAISNIQNSFEFTGIFNFTTFLIYTATINQLSQIKNGTAFLLRYRYILDLDQQAECIFLSPNFTYAQMNLYSERLSSTISPKVYSIYMTCAAFSLNTNLILNINTNMTILTNKQISSITKPSQLMCKSNSTQNLCRIHRLYDYYSQVSFQSYYGPYVLERSPAEKTFDYKALVEAIKNPTKQYILIIQFVLFSLLYYYLFKIIYITRNSNKTKKNQ